MIFKPVLLKEIFDGRKTVTRRPGVTKYEVGKRYAIQKIASGGTWKDIQPAKPATSGADEQ